MMNFKIKKIMKKNKKLKNKLNKNNNLFWRKIFKIHKGVKRVRYIDRKRSLIFWKTSR